MKYRVRIDLSFDSEADDSGEISFCDLEICRHDEGLPCTKLERVEVKKSGVIAS